MVYLVVCRSTLGGWTTEHAIVVFNHDYTTYTQTIQNNNNNLCITKLVKQWALCRWNCMMFESKIIIISNNCRLVFLMSPYWHNTSAEQTLIALWNPFLSLSIWFICCNFHWIWIENWWKTCVPTAKRIKLNGILHNRMENEGNSTGYENLFVVFVKNHWKIRRTGLICFLTRSMLMHTFGASSVISSSRCFIHLLHQKPSQFWTGNR